jgi:hypothetical protein
MTFADSFSQLMSDAGIPVDPNSVPDRDTVTQQLDDLGTWFWALDPVVREGFDEGSASTPVCHLLGEPELNVAPSILGILEGFDGATGQFSDLLSTATTCAAQADDGVG